MSGATWLILMALLCAVAVPAALILLLGILLGALWVWCAVPLRGLADPPQPTKYYEALEAVRPANGH